MKKLAKAMYGKIMMKGGSSKMKKYAKGGEGELGPVYTQPSGGKGGAGTYEPTTTTKTTKTYKTGGMVNANTKVSADKTPGSKGVKSGENAKVSASKKAKGKVGGTSKAPKKAKP
jgi:hypothetical protein